MRDLNSLNKVILIGHLVRKPDLRYLPKSGRPVTSFQIATNESVFNPDTKQASQRTEFHRIVAWGKLAEFCQKYLEQGRQILVEGKLRTRSWEGRDGNKRFSTEIEAQNIVMLGKKVSPQEEIAAEAAEGTFSEEAFPEISEPAVEEFPEETPPKDDEDDIPF